MKPIIKLLVGVTLIALVVFLGLNLVGVALDMAIGEFSPQNTNIVQKVLFSGGAMLVIVVFFCAFASALGYFLVRDWWNYNYLPARRRARRREIIRISQRQPRN